MRMLGPWLSIPIGNEPVAQLPATSQTEVLLAEPAPSPATVVSAGGGAANPDSPSRTVQATVTGPVHQPVPSTVTSAGRSGMPVTVGGVVSRGAVKGSLGLEATDVPRAFVAVTVNTCVAPGVRPAT